MKPTLILISSLELEVEDVEKIKSFFKEHRRVILCIATCGIALLCSCFLGGFLSSKRSYKYISGGLTGFGKSVAAGFLSSGLHSTVRDTEDRQLECITGTVERIGEGTYRIRERVSRSRDLLGEINRTVEGL